MSTPSIPEYIHESVRALPVLPTAVTRLLTLTRELDVDFGEVAKVIETDQTLTARVLPGHELRADERLNFLGIGVLAPARGRGVNLAMASYAYLELIRGGASHLSYTLVLDDNWPSRRTAEKLGARVCANQVVYRRELR